MNFEYGSHLLLLSAHIYRVIQDGEQSGNLTTNHTLVAVFIEDSPELIEQITKDMVKAGIIDSDPDSDNNCVYFITTPFEK